MKKMTTQEINKKFENIKFESDQAMSGYWRLMMNGHLFVDDPAEHDFYDKEIAQEMFDEKVDDELKEEWLPTINEALGLGFDMTMFSGNFEQLYLDCENHIMENGEPEMERCELHHSGNSQYYSFGNNNCTGEIFDFGRYTASMEVYFHEVDGKFIPCAWYDVPMHNEEGRNEYIFVFDTIVDTDTGKLISLYDYFE